AGGNTPKPLYEAIAKLDLPWDKIEVFWGDERYVSPDHPDSNQKMARDVWLSKVPIPEKNIHPMPTSANNPQLDAKAYERELKEFFGLKEGEFPTFDLIILGMGEDGHTASLFPHTAALQVKDSLVTVGEKNGEPRLTFTAELINHAKCVIFLVAGANKQKALQAVLAETGDSNLYPARLIQPQGELWWLLDKAAAAGIGDLKN
ncbi:MAG: 6-phosphogluconolactonase, partial [Cyanobacteria bacterium J083]